MVIISMIVPTGSRYRSEILDQSMVWPLLCFVNKKPAGRRAVMLRFACGNEFLKLAFDDQVARVGPIEEHDTVEVIEFMQKNFG
jgi:hypothetical protein